MTDRYSNDVERIAELMATMFESISWSPDSPPDWDAFATTFIADAVLAPSARPARLKTVDGFVAEMSGQRTSGALVALSETVIGHDIKVFANIAVALCSFRARINDTTESRGVNAFLFVKSDGEWRVAGTAWDGESEAHPMPVAANP